MKWVYNPVLFPPWDPFKYSLHAAARKSFSVKSSSPVTPMETNHLCSRFFFFFFFFFFFSFVGTFSSFLHPLRAQNDRQTYIVQLHPEMGSSLFESKLQWHLSILERTIQSEDEEEEEEGIGPASRLLYSYHSAIEGFAARLSERELQVLRSDHTVIAVHPDRRLELHTTYSYKFLGLGQQHGDVWAQSNFGQGTIIGVLDTGVWPESPSFDDRHMPPVPKRWRGDCEEGEQFTPSLCNRKLIGARFYTKGHRASSSPPPTPPPATEYVSPRDAHGHGTHTSSTAAGNVVPGASVFGLGAGEARGMAPGAHIAMYKVCWFSGCYSSDILAGMDNAIRDGVDILSLSLGGFPLPFYDDSIAIGAFRATERGISVVCAAGNNGPIPNSVANEAPWLTTVGASSLDRKFPAIVRMGDGQILYGESMYTGNRFPHAGKKLELVYEFGRSNGGELCFKGSLSKARVAGKMVVCDRGINGRAEKGEVVKEAGGAAMILANVEINKEEDSVDIHVLPATQIGYAESLRLKDYMNSTKRPTAHIEFGGTVIGRSRAPAVALFSSRGPSITNPSILKPDIIAPGVNIIAAWPENLGPTGLSEDTRTVNFTVLSGTSMACPHISGITALIRSAHPTWSPAAIRSAIMTTADVVDHSGKPIMDGSKPAGIFAIGAGHVNPARALDPGLVYDAKPDDYITHLCSLGYRRSDIFTITHRNTSCSEILSKNRSFSLNYPSISVIFKHGKTIKIIKRTVRNVGTAESTYRVQVAAPQGVKIRVRPQKLTFNRLDQSKVYTVWFISRNRNSKSSEGHLTWAHGHFKVRSPISVTWVR